MDKRTKKRSNYNEDILIVIREKYGYPLDYIRKVLRGQRTGEMPDAIKKDYAQLDRASKEAIKGTAKNLIPQ